MYTMNRATPAASWAGDLCHPLPLAAVLVLAVNDHLLKGSGILPGWLTGKLSDFAGLFFFPVLLAAIVRGALRLAGPRELPVRVLAAATTLATGVVFTLLKVHAPFNAWVTGVWGVNAKDVTDLLALPVLPLSAAFMLRGSGLEAPRGALPSPARRVLDLAAVVAAALASVATSPPPPPPPQVPPQPPQQAVAVAAPDTCASLAVAVCERSSTLTFVTVEARGVGPGTCQVDVLGAAEVTRAGARPGPDMLPAPVMVDVGATATFSLSFLRPVDPAEQTGQVQLELDVRRGRVGASGPSAPVVLRRDCTRR
jgi:hypothetical protein